MTIRKRGSGYRWKDARVAGDAVADRDRSGVIGQSFFVFEPPLLTGEVTDFTARRTAAEFLAPGRARLRNEWHAARGTPES